MTSFFSVYILLASRFVDKFKAIMIGYDNDRRSFVNAASQQSMAKRIEQHALQRALHGTCSEVGVVAFLRNQCHRRILKSQRHTLFLQALADSIGLQTNNLLNMALRERMEEDDVVNTI